MAKNIMKKNMTIAFVNEKNNYTYRDSSGVGLGVSLSEVRDGMQFQRNETPNNAGRWPIAFKSRPIA